MFHFQFVAKSKNDGRNTDHLVTAGQVS